MQTSIPTLLALALGTALAAGSTAGPTVQAQMAPSFPTLSYPTEAGPWGCHFTQTCAARPPGATGKS